MRAKINAHMDKLQLMMETQCHITDKVETEQQISICSGYFHVLDGEDREYVQMARFALEEQTKWKVQYTLPSSKALASVASTQQSEKKTTGLYL